VGRASVRGLLEPFSSFFWVGIFFAQMRKFRNKIGTIMYHNIYIFFQEIHQIFPKNEKL
jgi:hypothetical protein